MQFPIYRGEPLFVGKNKLGAWWSPFPEKAQGYRRNPFGGPFDFKSGNPGKILKAKTNLDDFRDAMRRVIVQHHTNLDKVKMGQPFKGGVVGASGRPYLKMSIADAFKQLDKDIADIKAGKTTLEKLAEKNVLFKEGYFTGHLKDTIKPKIAWGQTLKPLVGPLADATKEAVKTVGKGALKVAGPAGVGLGVYDSVMPGGDWSKGIVGAFKPWHPDPNNPAHSHLQTMDQYRAKILKKLKGGPLSEDK